MDDIKSTLTSTSQKSSKLQSWKHRLFGKHLPIRQRFFNIIFIFASLGGLSGTITCITTGSSDEAVMMSIAMTFIFPMLGIWCATAKEHRDIILFFSLAVMNMVVFPSLYMVGGAIDGGDPMFFAMGLALTLFLTRSKNGIILAIVEAVFYLMVFYFSYSNPDWVLPLPAWEVPGGQRDYTFNAITSNVIMAIAILGFLTKLLFNMYKKEDQLVSESIVEIERQSTIDPLTNVYNRRFMYSYLSEQVTKASESHTPLSVVLFDIDKFKNLNDTYGHLLGDDVLKALSRILRDSCRTNEVVARYGGEEFILILPGLDNNAAFKRANEIRECIEKSYLSPELPEDKPVTISGGVSTFHVGLTEENLVATADENLYKAKESGRNRIVK